MLLLLVAVAASGAALAAGVAFAASGPGTIVFPLIGPARYFDDFGDPRGQGAHQGNDILTAWRAPVVAAESGRVKWWTTSERAGCMLYLFGASGTTYVYVHLNNDVAHPGDNRGRCELDTAFLVPDGARVKAGEPIALAGDSGDAEGTMHLHFEIHPNDGAAVSPFPWLDTAARHLVPVALGTKFSVALRGTPVTAGDGQLELLADAVRWWPNGRWIPIEQRSVVVSVPPSLLASRPLASLMNKPARRALAGAADRTLTIVTSPMAATQDAISGQPGVLTAVRVTET